MLPHYKAAVIAIFMIVWYISIIVTEQADYKPWVKFAFILLLFIVYLFGIYMISAA